MAELANDIQDWREQFSRDLRTMQESGLVYHFEKVLLVAFLDALAKTARLGSDKKPRQRFIRLLEDFTPWKDGDRISVPHLSRLLELQPDPRFDRARSLVTELQADWNPTDPVDPGIEYPSTHIPLCRAPSLEDVSKIWPRGPSGKPLPVQPSVSKKQELTLQHLQHKNLLWKYRNILVHEANAGTKSIERPEFREPYYSWDLDPSFIARQKCWRLHFPLGFFRSLCGSALEAVEGYLLDKDLDPLPMWDRWNWWIDELNTA